MSDLPPGFERFLLHGAQASAMRAQFWPVLSGTDLEKSRAIEQVISEFQGIAGLYFWVMRFEGAEYKIYIGKTNSLSYRLLNYVSAFQAHSPNDYKLRIFHAFLTEVLPSASLDLYFARKTLDELTSSETEAVSQYRPLLNRLPPPTADAKDHLRKAFSIYYRSAFEQRLRGDV